MLARKLIAPTAGGGGWQPSDLSGLMAWYDASDSGSLTLSGADVTQWNDLSGNGYHLTQGTAGRYPQYGATSFNSSYPGLTFAGGDWMTVAAFALGADATSSAVAVCTLDTNVTGQRLLSMTDSTNLDDYDNGGVIWIFQVSDAETAFLGFASSQRSKVTGSTATPYVIMSVYDGTNHIIYRGASNAETAGNTLATTYATDSTGTLAVGVGYESGAVTGKSWKGKLAEVFILNRALTSGERTDILSYVNTKWGV